MSVNADVNGSIVFGNIGADADLGAAIVLEISCVRSLGGAEPTLRHTLRVLGLAAQWITPPRSVLFSYSPFSVAVRVVDANGVLLTNTLLAGTAAADGNASSGAKSSVDVVCTLIVSATASSGTSASVQSAITLIGESTSYLKPLDMQEPGSVAFSGALRPTSAGVNSGSGPEGRYGYLSVVCTMGLRAVESPRLPVLLPRLGLASASTLAPSTLREPLRPPELLCHIDSIGRH